MKFTHLLIAGPTASGKSKLAVEVAQAIEKYYQPVIINCDSMQVYAGLPVLTAQPDEGERAGFRHELYGFVDIEEIYSTGAYLRDYRALQAQFHSKTIMPILVGGTGLYFKALTKGLVETPKIPENIQNMMDEQSLEGLFQRLSELDPEIARKLSNTDRPRIERALGVYLATGKSIRIWRENAHGAPLLDDKFCLKLFIETPREILYERINTRMRHMVDRGALEEVQLLLDAGLETNRGLMKAHGVPYFVKYLNDEMTLDEAIQAGQQDVRHYARRQHTWFRHQMSGWDWIPQEKALDYVLDRLGQSG